MPSGIDLDYRPLSALETPEEEREAEFERRWAHGGLSFLGCFADLLFKEDANRTAADFVRAQDRGHRGRPGNRPAAGARRTSSAASASAWTPATTRPSTGPMSSLSMFPSVPSRRLRRAACARTGGSGRRTPSWFATRLRRHDGGAGAHRHSRRGRAPAAGCVGRGAARPISASRSPASPTSSP